MAGFIRIVSEGDKFTVGEVTAFANELKRRKVSRSVKVETRLHVDNSKLEMRVPYKVRRVVLPPQELPTTKTPMRGAKRKKA